MGAAASAGLSKSFWQGRMWLLASSSEICWFSTALGGSALGRLLMFSSGVNSSCEVAPGGALHGDFSGGLVGLDTATKLSSSELLSSSTGSCITWDLERGGN